MKVTYTEEAVADIVQAIIYLNERNPAAAAKPHFPEPVLDMLDVGLMHPLKTDRLHQLHDPLETRAHIRRQGVKLCLGLGTDKAERPLHAALYLICNR